MTIKDIARESGYAVATVSRVLNNRPDVSPEAREKIQAVLEAHNFTPNNNARHLKQPSSHNIAIIINRTVKGMFNVLFSSILEEMQIRLKEKGYSCLIYYMDQGTNEVERALQLCRERKPLALIFLGGSAGNFRKSFAEIDIPSVFVTKTAAECGFKNLSNIYTDNVAGADCAASYLIKNGHENIVILGGDLSISSTARQRLEGAMRAMQRAGIPFDQDRQYITAQHIYSSAYEAMNVMLDRVPELTAVFAQSDVMAIGCIRALQDRNLRVPEDVSIIGYDGTDISSYYCPRLATIRQNAEQLARRSVDVLIDSLENDAPPVNEIIPFELIPGETVRNIREPEAVENEDSAS